MARELTSIEPLLPVLRERPFGLLSDIDGTLSPIVPRPEDAAVPEAIRALLGQLVAKGVKVALITGRSLDTARRIIGLDQVGYAADHGLTLWLESREEAAPGLAEYEALARETEQELLAFTEAIQGVQLENKGPLLTVHYRRAGDPARAREAVLDALEHSATARRFRVQEGRMVIELRPPLDTDKGTALGMLVQRLGLRGAVCLGDDITDIDMFATVRRLRSQRFAGASVAVASEEAAPQVAEAADYTLAGQERVEWLLTELIRALP